MNWQSKYSKDYKASNKACETFEKLLSESEMADLVNE